MPDSYRKGRISQSKDDADCVGGGSRVAPPVALAADNQPEMGNSESRRRSPPVLSQARIAPIGSRRHEQARTFKPVALIRRRWPSFPSASPSPASISSLAIEATQARRFSGIVAHVFASAYYYESWPPDRVPGLLPGVSTTDYD